MVNIVEEIANEFLDEYYVSSENKNYFLNGLDKELSRYKKEADKIIFLKSVRSSIQEMYDDHFANCKEKKDCETLKWHLKSIFYVNNLLEDYSISEDKNDCFTSEEKQMFCDKLDKIIDEIEILKKGQNVIYDDLSEEIEEMKGLFYLGKKNWKTLLVGKGFEMVAGGVVSETISKELINLSGLSIQNLLK